MATSTTEIPSILTPIQPQSIPATDTTLFHLAAQYLGDATMWNYVLGMNPGLINADGFWEYEVNGAATITLPLAGQNVSNGGILNAFPPPGTSRANSFSPGFGTDFSVSLDFSTEFSGLSFITTPPSVLTWTALQGVYPSLLTLNGGVVMTSSGFPTSPPSGGGQPWSNGGVLMLTSSVFSAGSPFWVSFNLPTSSVGLVPGSVYLNGLVVSVV